MGLESSFNFIDDLNTSNPASGDNPSQGDDHLRGIKSAVKGSFTSLGSAAVTKTAAEINDLATLTGTETLTNKTLTSPVLNTPDLNDTEISNFGGGSEIEGTLYVASGESSNIWTSIPSWVKTIKLVCYLQQSSATDLRVRLGTSSGIDTISNYRDAYAWITGTSANETASLTSPSFSGGRNINTSSDLIMSTAFITNLTGDTWMYSSTWGSMSYSGTATGRKSLTGTLDRLEIYTASTFSSGNAQIYYSG